MTGALSGVTLSVRSTRTWERRRSGKTIQGYKSAVRRGAFVHSCGNRRSGFPDRLIVALGFFSKTCDDLLCLLQGCAIQLTDFVERPRKCLVARSIGVAWLTEVLPHVRLWKAAPWRNSLTAP
jgi:hypothetical protein